MASPTRNSPTMTAEFHLFPELPFELRIRIWELTREPRVLRVEARAELDKHRRRPLDYTLLYCASPEPVPAVLQTCRESRNLGLYERSFAGGLAPRHIWVDFQVDTIRATYWDLKLLRADKARIRHLSIQVENAGCFLRHYPEAVAGLRLLETMELFTREPLPGRADLIAWARDTMRRVPEEESPEFARITLVEGTTRTMSWPQKGECHRARVGN
ncbi:hypothetical protein LX36DRAFT_660262 [Colletotrichum falcatum]|nr:hypothetical protein LX36DRAFT_660262 [Colletotrichum falcatum]